MQSINTVIDADRVKGIKVPLEVLLLITTFNVINNIKIEAHTC